MNLENQKLHGVKIEDRQSHLFSKESDFSNIVIENSLTGILQISSSGDIQLVNKEVCRIFGYSKVELLNKKIEILVPEYIKNKHVALRDSYFETPSTRSLTSSKSILTGQKKDGTLVPVEIGLVPIKWKKNLVTLAFINDISDKLNLKRFFNLSLDMFCIVSLHGQYLQVNPAFSLDLGWKDDDTLNQNIFWNLHEDDRDKLKNALLILKEGKPVKNLIIRYKNSLHEYRVFSWSATPFENIFYAVLHDITDEAIKEEQLEASNFQLRQINGRLKDSNDQLEQKSIELERSNQDLEQFAYIASHDLQEPLRKIMSYSDLLSEKVLTNVTDDDTEYIFSVISKSVQRMQTLIHDLLQFSRVGRKNWQIEMVNLNEILNIVTENLDLMIKENNAQILVNQLPVIAGDKIHFIMLLQNLISNGIKFQSPGTPPVINITHIESEMGWTFIIKDNGIGIDEKYFQKLFILFSRLHGKGKYSGSGIGLAVCKKIIEKLNGRLWVESNIGSGSEFKFFIPKN